MFYHYILTITHNHYIMYFMDEGCSKDAEARKAKTISKIQRQGSGQQDAGTLRLTVCTSRRLPTGGIFFFCVKEN